MVLKRVQSLNLEVTPNFACLCLRRRCLGLSQVQLDHLSLLLTSLHLGHVESWWLNTSQAEVRPFKDGWLLGLVPSSLVCFVLTTLATLTLAL